jgi:hypothetical protein
MRIQFALQYPSYVYVYMFSIVSHYGNMLELLTSLFYMLYALKLNGYFTFEIQI